MQPTITRMSIAEPKLKEQVDTITLSKLKDHATLNEAIAILVQVEEIPLEEFKKVPEMTVVDKKILVKNTLMLAKDIHEQLTNSGETEALEDSIRSEEDGTTKEQLKKEQEERDKAGIVDPVDEDVKDVSEEDLSELPALYSINIDDHVVLYGLKKVVALERIVRSGVEMNRITDIDQVVYEITDLELEAKVKVTK